MPTWALAVTGLAAVIVACGVIWTKAVKPVAKMIVSADEALPVMRNLTETFGDDPDLFRVIRNMAAEFRSNSGTTLRDVVNRLEQASIANRDCNDELKETVTALQESSEALREMARVDREQVGRLLVLLGQLQLQLHAQLTGPRPALPPAKDDNPDG